MGLFKSKEEKAKAKYEKQTQTENLKNELKNFKNNHDYNVGAVYFNDSDKRFLLKKSFFSNHKQSTVNYSELISYTPILDPGKLKKHHGITRAIVGNVIAGPIGALVGATTGGKEIETIKRLGFTLHLEKNKSITYLIINSETKADSLAGKSYFDDYNNLSAKFDQIISANSQILAKVNDVSPTDEIRKYKALLDDGIITQEEFDKKKLELLRQ